MPSHATKALRAEGEVGSAYEIASHGPGAVCDCDAIGTGSKPQDPILEPWRILALALIVAAGMLFVHLIVPADASADPARAAAAAVHSPQP